jgi:hypothetical protein
MLVIYIHSKMLATRAKIPIYRSEMDIFCQEAARNGKKRM